jgi:CBS domain-containing protein
MATERVVGDLMGTAVVTISPQRTLRDAAELLTLEEVGVGVVRNASGPIGIISERDIVRALAEGEDPDDARVAEHMSFEVCGIEADATVAEAAREMSRGNIRHLVVRRGSEVAGVLSARDLVFATAAG